MHRILNTGVVGRSAMTATVASKYDPVWCRHDCPSDAVNYRPAERQQLLAPVTALLLPPIARAPCAGKGIMYTGCWFSIVFSWVAITTRSFSREDSWQRVNNTPTGRRWLSACHNTPPTCSKWQHFPFSVPPLVLFISFNPLFFLPSVK